MHYVYILRSINSPDQIYTGSTSNIEDRMRSHNKGANNHTSKFKPWELVWYCAFAKQRQAEDFEQYLKTASGIAFKRKRFL